MAGRLDELRTPSFAHELSARSEFLDGSSMYEDPRPNALERGLPSADDEGVIGIAHRPSRSTGFQQALQMQNSWREKEDSEADIVTRQRLVSQKLLGRKSVKGLPQPVEEQQLKPPHLHTEASSASRRAFVPAPHNGPERWQANLQGDSHLTPPQSFQAPEKRDFTQSGSAFPAANQPDQQLLQSLMMSQMQQQQQGMHYPVQWPFLPYMPPGYPWPLMQQASTGGAPLRAPLERQNKVEYAPKPAPPLSTQSSQLLERDLSSSAFKMDSLKSRKEAPLETSSEAALPAVRDEGAPLEALSELVSRNRETQELVNSLRQELQDEQQLRQRAEERCKDLEQAVAAIRSREQELEEQVSDSQSRCQRLEEESRQGRQRLKEAETELEAARRKAQDEAERLMRLERKDLRLLAEFEEIQARDQHDLEALSEEKRRLESELGELRKLPVSLEMLREDNEGLRARLQRAEKDRSNLQELVGGFRQTTADLEQANRRLTTESDALRKECNMLKLQLASKDTSISQLQVALFSGRQEKSDLQHQLRRLEEAASAFDAPLSRRGSLGLNSDGRAESSFYSGSEVTEQENDGTTPAEAQHYDDVRLSRPAFVPLAQNGDADRTIVSASKLSSPLETPSRNGSNGIAKSTGKIVNNEEMRVAGVSNSVFKNRAQQLAGNDMRRSLTMELPLDRANSSTSPERTLSTNPQNEAGQNLRMGEQQSNARREVPTKETPVQTPSLSSQSRADLRGPQESVRSPTKEQSQFSLSTPSAMHQTDPGSVNKAREPLPFATEQSLLETMDETAAIESKLMEVSLERSKLESEYAKLPQSAGRTMTERRRKQELEGQIEDLTKKIGWLRMELRERHVLHR